MSATLPTDVICPGQRSLLGSGGHYLRVVCMVYWDGASPSAQPFYLHSHRFELSLTGVTTLEAEILGLLQQHYHDHTPLGVVYLGYEGITLTEAEQASIDWRLLHGQS